MRIPPFNAALKLVARRLPAVQVIARAKLPTKHGDFEIVAFETEDGRRLDDVAVVRGELVGARDVDVDNLNGVNYSIGLYFRLEL